MLILMPRADFNIGQQSHSTATTTLREQQDGSSEKTSLSQGCKENSKSSRKRH